MRSFSALLKNNNSRVFPRDGSFPALFPSSLSSLRRKRSQRLFFHPFSPKEEKEKGNKKQAHGTLGTAAIPFSHPGSFLLLQLQPGVPACSQHPPEPKHGQGGKKRGLGSWARAESLGKAPRFLLVGIGCTLLGSAPLRGSKNPPRDKAVT